MNNKNSTEAIAKFHELIGELRNLRDLKNKGVGNTILAEYWTLWNWLISSRYRIDNDEDMNDNDYMKVSLIYKDIGKALNKLHSLSYEKGCNAKLDTLLSELDASGEMNTYRENVASLYKKDTHNEHIEPINKCIINFSNPNNNDEMTESDKKFIEYMEKKKNEEFNTIVTKDDMLPNQKREENIESKTDNKETKNNEDGNAKSSTHYQQGRLQPIEIMQDYMTNEEMKGFVKGNAIKYILRAEFKGTEEKDIVKAMQYMKWYIDLLEGKKINPRE